MATITIKNVPNEVVSEIWTSIEYSKDLKFLWKKRILNIDKIEYWDDREIKDYWKNNI